MGLKRIRWEFDDIREIRQKSLHQDSNDQLNDLSRINDLIRNNAFTAHFQPIFQAKGGSVLGYEALIRTKEENPFASICKLFQKAILTGSICTLNFTCFETTINAIKNFAIHQKKLLLFINVCPEALIDSELFIERCDQLLEKTGISKENIVIELTEESVISDYIIFKKSLQSYRQKGFRIAIDDFGTGYGGLKMLSTLEPDFVKIDQEFIANIDNSMVNLSLVEAIATACNRIGIKTVAEGIEREEELSAVLNTGVDYLQGFFLGKPEAFLNTDSNSLLTPLQVNTTEFVQNSEFIVIGDIVQRIEPVEPFAPVVETVNMFIENPELRGLPVVKSGKIVGILNRSRFLENKIIGRHGFGLSMNTYKKVSDVMEQNLFLFEADTTFEEVSRRIQSRKPGMQLDDICVVRNGEYWGMVAVSMLLEAISERNIILARGSNPLSGLPGNDYIQREITRRIKQKIHFDVLYIDIDHFKPYNDHYGFEKGDIVIKSLATILTTQLSCRGSDSFTFAGHIGGDDFIVITRPQISMAMAEKIISEFNACLPDLHGIDDYDRKIYSAKNRKGEMETFNLLSLSIGIVSTEPGAIESYAQLASLATEIKKAAKMQDGFSIVRDRRLIK